MPVGVSQVKFDGAFSVQDDEISYVELPIPNQIGSAIDNPTNIHPFDIDNNEIKGFFRGNKNNNRTKEVYVQNFDSRKLLSNKKILVYSSNTIAIKTLHISSTFL